MVSTDRRTVETSRCRASSDLLDLISPRYRCIPGFYPSDQVDEEPLSTPCRLYNGLITRFSATPGCTVKKDQDAYQGGKRETARAKEEFLGVDSDPALCLRVFVGRELSERGISLSRCCRHRRHIDIDRGM